MRAYPEGYLHDIVESQGKLFDFVSQNYPEKDTSDFINTYMTSKTRESIDQGKAYVSTMNASELWDYFQQTEHYHLKNGKALKGFIPDWIGEFYAYYQWFYNVSSKEIIKKVPLDFLTKAYMGLHDLELDNPDEENGYLSNWYLSEFNVSNITFSSMEQFMMYQKAMCFCDQTIAKKILTTHDVAQIKKFGRQVSNYNENRWNGIRQIVVYEGLLAKFSQNLNLKDLLKATGDNLLAECAVKDKIWGVGLSMSDPDRLDITKWKGQNLLGYSLMMVREKI